MEEENIENRSNPNQFIKLDVHSLLKTIKELENQLTDYGRNDQIPPWAIEIISRLELLEKRFHDKEIQETYNNNNSSNNTRRETQIPINNDNNQSSIIYPYENQERPRTSDKDKDNFDRTINRIKNDNDANLEGIRITLETKITSLNIELDRIYKLLNIRPTMSEFQSIINDINKIDEKIDNTTEIITTNVNKIIQDNITNEMSNLLYQLKMNETYINQNVTLLSNKYENINESIMNVQTNSNDFQNITELSIEQFKSRLELIESNYDLLNEKFTNELKLIQSNVTEMQYTLQQAGKLFTHHTNKQTNRQTH